MRKQLVFVVLAVLFAQSASAQQIYKWKDEKGQWHYADFLPIGVIAEKVEIAETAQEPVSQPSLPSAGEQENAKDNSDHSTQARSDVDPLGSAPGYLLVFPPSDPGRPLSEWIPMDSFASVAECQRARFLEIDRSVVQGTDRVEFVDFRTLNSRCISLAQFKPRKEANVIVSVTSLGSDPGGFSTWVLYGRVFNGGQTIAQNVVVKYRVRDARGIIYGNGEIVPASKDIPPLAFAEYRGQILGSAGGSDRWVETEANWSKD